MLETQPNSFIDVALSGSGPTGERQHGPSSPAESADEQAPQHHPPVILHVYGDADKDGGFGGIEDAQQREHDTETSNIKLENIDVRPSNIVFFLKHKYDRCMFEPPVGLLQVFEKAGLSTDQARKAASALYQAHKDDREALRKIWQQIGNADLASVSSDQHQRDYGGAHEADLPSPDTIAASQQEPNTKVDAEGSPPLRIPVGDVPKFKGRASEVYDFLLQTYDSANGGQEPLTLEYLRTHDEGALIAFRSRRRSAEVPAQLKVLEVEGFGTKMTSLLEKHGVDVSTPEGIAEAKRLGAVIRKMVYENH